MMKKIISVFAVCTMLCGIFTGCAKESSTNEKSFTAWVDDSEAIAALEEYVEDVTNEKSQNFIPAEDRIAVFDLDGTLYCETFPIYGEWLLFADYVLNTPDYEATEEIMAVATELSEIKKAADIPSHMEQTHIHAHAEVFAGMTIEDYMDVVEDFKNTDADGFNGMTRGEAFYIPMLEVVEYLLDNDFIVYICSGTNRFTVRALIDDVIDIPARQVIGTDFTIVASGQGEEMDMHYNYGKNAKKSYICNAVGGDDRDGAAIWKSVGRRDDNVGSCPGRDAATDAGASGRDARLGRASVREPAARAADTGADAKP